MEMYHSITGLDILLLQEEEVFCPCMVLSQDGMLSAQQMHHLWYPATEGHPEGVLL